MLGIRLGWLDKSYLPVVDHAWSGLSARIAEDGGLADVCTGTGAGPNLRYYYERPAVFGFDDRGGGMSLLAAFEVAELRKQAPSSNFEITDVRAPDDRLRPYGARTSGVLQAKLRSSPISYLHRSFGLNSITQSCLRDWRW